MENINGELYVAVKNNFLYLPTEDSLTFCILKINADTMSFQLMSFGEDNNS